MYTEDDLLYISNIQHFCFCPRQWQLIEVEQIWQDNHLTALGQLLHRRVDDPEITSRSGMILTLRSVPLVSYTLGLFGLSDVVELYPTSEGQRAYFTHPKYPGHRFQPVPVEYKRGKSKRNNADRLQLCAQAICLEEMYQVLIPVGYLYYGETKHREKVALDEELRNQTRITAENMHQAFRSKRPLGPVYSKRCKSCSLFDECLPKISSHRSAKGYLQKNDVLTP